MCDTPDKIWIDRHCWDTQESNIFDTPYTRTELVDELIEAIAEAIAEALDDSGVSYTTNRVDAAIAEIKGE